MSWTDFLYKLQHSSTLQIDSEITGVFTVLDGTRFFVNDVSSLQEDVFIFYYFLKVQVVYHIETKDTIQNELKKKEMEKVTIFIVCVY